ncbi:MAG: DUF2330 domain-containing protein, partial [Planctomycetota bacterium]|nr:DUF2330 domain-containing protein [Planctomycetota bacterium]
AAIDPPEVVIDLRMRWKMMRQSSRGDEVLMMAEKEMDGAGVRVIRREAVGMYEVVVLEAGSAAALSRWMEDHGFRYPEGMDDVCNDYVEMGWCFVAVKTRVGQKAGVDPRPGMRDVDSKLPKGASFDGYVQAMGFRFRSEELVVPMRLSAFNEGELHNTVYILADGPMKIRSIPEEHVKRQVSGTQLRKNLTSLLPLRIIGGKFKDIPEWRKETLKLTRNPEPFSGLARDLFASDLLSASRGELSHPFEEQEKELLRIGERLGLRGPELDAVHQQTLAELRKEILKGALEDLAGMTLSVVDGDFPREVLAKENLTFARYEMPANNNIPGVYDAKLQGPAPKSEGTLRLGFRTQPTNPPMRTLGFWVGIAMLGLVFVTAGGRRRGSRAGVPLFCLALIVTLAGPPQPVMADEPTLTDLVSMLDDGRTAEGALEALVKRAEEAIPSLLDEAVRGGRLTRRGWAIAALAEIGGDRAREKLFALQADPQQALLVRNWAAAALARMAPSVAELGRIAWLSWTFPSLIRPLGLRLDSLLAEDSKGSSVEDYLSLANQVPVLQTSILSQIRSFGPAALAEVMRSGSDQQLRWQATAYLGSMSALGDEGVAAAVIEAYRFDPEAKEVPWNGGPLYVPGIRWGEDDAVALVGNLIRWHLYCDRHDLSQEQNQIRNNIVSLQLRQVAGYQPPTGAVSSTVSWLEVWKEVVGRSGIRKILKEQGVLDDPKYAGVS